jgi:hypothetical protein
MARGGEEDESERMEREDEESRAVETATATTAAVSQLLQRYGILGKPSFCWVFHELVCLWV